ncbi:hypothetical protein PHSY_002676 [Pseudozyma hubeiensis SY62]|uniref:Uncharacterized protein n=1 Tax=Pseudozyma hubeiensis (strain SY62) TaxID=1305764 RepID=R9P1I7_PSEHS|nr:hypothetical protein PHSY_002676 [Pseudozyma hubeiensis SY62]GAC95101.1 hypothetical protein PHSY_002676 [Pseudozyma hubeiensis SY62]
MAEHELFNTEYDAYDELADEDIKSPKKAKKETKRNAAGCVKHWVAWRRKLETTLLGAPTVDGNGKKLIKRDIVKDDDTK